MPQESFTQLKWVAEAQWNEARCSSGEAVKLVDVATTTLQQAKSTDENAMAEQQVRVAQAWLHSRQRQLEDAKKALDLARSIGRVWERSSENNQLLRGMVQQSAEENLPGATTLLRQLTLVNSEWGLF